MTRVAGFLVPIVGLVFLAGWSCSKPKEIKIEPAQATLTRVGETVDLKATALDQDGKPIDGAKFTWSSSAVVTARVDETGKVTGVSSGGAVIAAVFKDVKGEAVVKVKIIGTLEVTPDYLDLKGIGVTAEFKASVKDETGNVISGEKVTWSSATPQIVTVDEKGAVTTVSAGEGKIMASAGAVSATVTIKVIIPEVASISVSPSPAEVTRGGTLKLIATVLDSTGNPIPGTMITWSSSDPSKASVDGQGVVTGVSYGRVTITAQAKEKTATAVVRIK